MKPQLNIVTSNEMKFRQHVYAWGEDLEVRQIPMELLEIQGLPQEIIEHKVKQAWVELQQPLIVDDGALEIEAIGGFPGPYIKHMLKAMGASKIAQMFEGSRIRAYCYLGYTSDGTDCVVVEGVTEGIIVPPKIVDEKHFNSFFQPDGADKTFQEMSFEEIMRYSHRKQAVEKLKLILKN